MYTTLCSRNQVQFSLYTRYVKDLNTLVFIIEKYFESLLIDRAEPDPDSRFEKTKNFYIQKKIANIKNQLKKMY